MERNDMEALLHAVIGQRIRRLRSDRGLSQDDLAQRIGRSQTYISQIEQGSIARPALASLVPLARALGVPLASLLPTQEWPAFADYLRELFGLEEEQIDFVVQLIAALQAERPP